MKSMTAYAQGKKVLPKGILEVNIKSLNHRAMELEFLGDGLDVLQEDGLRQFCKKNVHRGKIRITIHFGGAMVLEKPQFNHTLLQHFLSIEQEFLAMNSNRKPFSLGELLALPGVLERARDDEAPTEELEKLFQEVFAVFLNHRQQEGQMIKTFLKEKADLIQQELNQLNQKLPEINALYREKMRQKLQEWQNNYPPERFLQEWANHLLKTDIAEELSRLHAHLQSFFEIVESAAPHGKRLDFLMQELMREANTLASKAISYEITQSALSMKVLIEQMREQIQNVE